jgi:enterochelin esterase-like enzyme
MPFKNKAWSTLLVALPIFAQEVLPDHRVTFRINAPKASEVTLTTDWLPQPERMTKGVDGTWSVTLGPLAPATYIYSFTVDGVIMADPVNPRIKLRARGSGSLFDVPAETPAVWQARDVPHGTVEINWQRSTILKGETRSIWAYTPPGFGADPNRRYPVMYLLHGSNDTAAGWTTAGSVNMILDNLIAEKKAVPMIVVMPFGHAAPYGTGRGGPDNTELFEQYLLNDVMPMVERKYRIAADRNQRAIAGNSMGGEQALVIGFGHMDLFSSIGALSPAMPRQLAARWEAPLNDATGTNMKFKNLWIACGRQDPQHLGASRKIAEALKQHQIKHTYLETDGAHNYAIWQIQMTEFAPLLFH